MRDKILETQIELLSQFIESWQEFGTMFMKARGEEEITAQDEERFSLLRESIFQKYNIVMDSLELADGKGSKGVEILNQAKSMDSSRNLSEGMAKRFISNWESKQIEFQKIMGELEQAKDELSKLKLPLIFMKKAFINPISIIIYFILILFTAYKIISVFSRP